MPRYVGALPASRTRASRPFVVVAISAAPSQERDAGGRARVEGLALVDTGAEQSAISRTVADRLGLNTNDTTPIVTCFGERDLPAYSVRIEIRFEAPDLWCEAAGDLPVFEDRSSWVPQMIGLDVVGIIGMDVLQKCVLKVDGPAAVFELSMDASLIG